jgi:hypothetical protein
VVDDGPQREDHVAGLGGQPAARRQLGQARVRVAEVGKGAAQGGAGVGLLGAGTDLLGDGDRLLGQPSGLREAVHQHQLLRERAQHLCPLHRWPGCHQPHRLLLRIQRGGVAELAQAAGELLVQQAGPLGLARRIDQPQGLADQFRGPGGVAGRVGGLGAARQQRHLVGARALGGVGDPVPQPEHPLQLQLGLGKGRHLLGGGRGRDAGGQGAWLVAGGRPVVGQPRRPAHRHLPGLDTGLQRSGQGGVQPDPFAGQQLTVDRLGHQRVAEHIALAGGVGQQQLLVDRLVQAVKQLLVPHAGHCGQQRLGGARAGRGGHPQQPLST